MFLEHKYSLGELLKRCKAGERKAQEQLYKQFASKMMGVCLRYAADRMEAEDMLQNGFIRVFQKMDDFRGDGSFEGWIRRIMVHSSIEYYRKHHKMLVLSNSDELPNEPSVNPVAAANLDARDMMALVQRLSPGYRMVFNLYAIEGYSHREIGDMMGISEGASKSQLSRARSILKGLIANTEGKRYGYAG
ncbi:MAG: sigma-70 family RNA polymerase sigma factor [Bacteroidetes bacterium]|nr:sigma-70 family RNA polymerase sigma factor [Bacteroidota bacterium]